MSPETKARFRVDVKTVIAALMAAAGASVYIAHATASAEVGSLRTEYVAHKAAQIEAEANWKDQLERMNARLRYQSRKLDALCRATPGAQCPLGEE